MTGLHNQQQVVLVVDDEPLIRMLAIDILHDHGLAAHEAADGVEALAVLASHPEIVVLLTDINMPGVPDGLGLAREARIQRPQLHIVVTSGRVQPGPDELPTGGIFLAKPYTSTDLIDAIARCAGCDPDHKVFVTGVGQGVAGAMADGSGGSYSVEFPEGKPRDYNDSAKPR